MVDKSINLKELKHLAPERMLAHLRDSKESQWLERKSARVTAKKLANAMAGFANAEGGIIVIGIHHGVTEGIDSVSRANDWRQASLDFTLPPIRHTFEYLPCVNSKGQADRLAVIEIEAIEHVHENQKGVTYLRVGDETRKLNFVESQELLYDKGESSYDATIIDGVTLDDLDKGLVKKYLSNIGASEDRMESALKARGLMKAQEGSVGVTLAGLLILGSCPQAFLPQAHVRVLAYNGRAKETGVRLNVIHDERIEGALSLQIEKTRRSLQRLLSKSTHLNEESTFENSTIVPEYVWVEAVVNALTHRSYSVGGDHIRVEVFSDRVEIRSPGRLPGLVRLENIRSTRFARNPRIARALSDIRYGRELGEGVNRMFEEMYRAGLPDPVFEQAAAAVRVVLLEDSSIGRLLRYLPNGSERLAEFLAREGRVTTSEAVSLLGITRPTVIRHLRELERNNLLEHVGTSKMDPRGYWTVKHEIKRG